MINHLVQSRHARLKRLLAVLIKEKFGIRQARTHHTFVTANHGAGIAGRDVADDQELVGELATGI